MYFCLNNYSSTISFDSIYKLFKQKYKISKKTIVNYFQYLENSFFIFLLKKYSNSLKERIVSKRKLYLIDLSFSIFGNKEITKDLENIVFLELTKQKYYKNLNLELFYYKTKENYEVDFLIKEKGRIKELINVTYANSYEEINEREIRSLLHAKEELKLSNKIPLTIITWDYEDKKEISWFGKKGVISFIPLWKWLLKI
ncbi:MAG TPA: ATP-binding protein [Nautiliaceae bacterium]|nr:ATP-binding protein [Nautiliaceae bacterium]